MEIIRMTPDMIELAFDDEEKLIGAKVILGWQEITYGRWPAAGTFTIRVVEENRV